MLCMVAGWGVLMTGACRAAEPTDSQTAATKEERASMTLQLSSTAFEPGAYIPKKHTGEGPDLSPPLKWTDPPPGAKTFALICDDPDAPVGTWVHWVIWAMPASTRELPEAILTQKLLENGMKQGMNDFHKIGYGGPMPPRGSDHRYFFRLYALDTDLALNPGATRKELLNAMKGHILAQGELMGRYKR